MKCDKTKQSVIIDLQHGETHLPRWNPVNRSVLYPSLTRPFSDDDDGDDDGDDAFLEISHKPKNMETDRNEKTPDQEERVWSSETHTHTHALALTHTHTRAQTHGPTARSSPKKSTPREKESVDQRNILPQGEADAQVSGSAMRTKSLQVSLRQQSESITEWECGLNKHSDLFVKCFALLVECFIDRTVKKLVFARRRAARAGSVCAYSHLLQERFIQTYTLWNTARKIATFSATTSY